MTDFEQLIDMLQLPDPDDRQSSPPQSKAVLTSLSPPTSGISLRKLDRWGIEAQHPDEFLTHQFHLSQPVFLQAVKTVRLRLKNPPKSVEDYLDTLRVQGLLATVKAIEPFDQFI